jgi:hypothetical protein
MDMPIRETVKAHGAAILMLMEALGRQLPDKYFSLQTGESNSAYLITGFNPVNSQAVQCGIFIKVASSRRSPWSYSFHENHQDELRLFRDKCGEAFSIYVNGTDGFTVLNFAETKIILDEEHEEQEWVAISRKPRQGYRVSGNDGRLNRPIPQNSYPSIMIDYFKREFSDEKSSKKRRVFSLRALEKLFSK